MKVLLIGDYFHSNLQSMRRFVELLQGELLAQGHEVRVLRPQDYLCRFKAGEHGLGKWFGYIDRFALFIPALRRAARWADVVHICDHGNAMYVRWVSHKPNLVTCHDVLAIQIAYGLRPEQQVGRTGRLYQQLIHEGLAKAQRVVCVSENTRKELIALGRVLPSRIAVVGNGLNHPYGPIPEALRSAQLSAAGLDPERPYFLHVGGNQWYKNRAGVIELYARLRDRLGDQCPDLVMAGKPWPPLMSELVAKYGIQAHCKALVSVSNESLETLYSGATALLFPSLEEGFGWPLIEAQACGCPVFTSNREPMMSVGGAAARYFDPADLDAAVDVVLAGLAERVGMVAAGYDNAARYSPAVMSREYLAEYQAVQAVGATT